MQSRCCALSRVRMRMRRTSDQASRGLEEVVVTATKRGETDMQKTAESIYALAETICAEARDDFEAFAGSVPGLQFQNLGPGDSEYIIRGINGSGPVRRRCVPRRVRHHGERSAGWRRQERAGPARRRRARRSAQRPAGHAVRIEFDGGQHPLHHAQAGCLEVRRVRRS